MTVEVHPNDRTCEYCYPPPSAAVRRSSTHPLLLRCLEKGPFHTVYCAGKPRELGRMDSAWRLVHDWDNTLIKHRQARPGRGTAQARDDAQWEALR